MAVDVTILGAGVFGLSIAFHCLQRGAKVRVIDPGGVGSGASGGVVGALAPHTPDNWNPKKQFQFESLIMGRSFWPKVAEISRLPTGYSPAGRLTPILHERQIPQAISRAADAAQHWHGQATWNLITTKPHDDWHPPSPTGHFVYDTLSAHIHPRLATAALAKAVTELGGTITAQGALQGHVVEATGWQGLIELSQKLAKPAGNGVKGQAALLDISAKPGAPQLFADGLHIVPHVDGGVAVGSTSERIFDVPDSVDGQLDDIISRAKRLFPVLQDAGVIQRWAGVRPRAITRAPLLGRHPIRPDRYIANGGFKIGFGMAPKVGQVLADFILEETMNWPDEFCASHLV